MSQQQRIKIPRQPDRKIVEVFKALSIEYGASQAHISTFAYSNIGAVSLSNEPTDAFKVLLDHNSELIESMSLSIGGLGINAEHQERATTLDERERSIEEKLKEIDDRDNTHARREIRNRMLDDVKERIKQFGVSKATQDKRLPVLSGMAVLMVALLVLLYWTGTEISKVDVQPQVNDTELYFLWIRFALFSFGLLGTILYYIKWQNKWADEHASSEFQLQQFYIDVNRANWVIESCLEWRKETGSAIPKELLTSVTNGLFVNNKIEPERVIHPADELASALLGSASNLKLKVGDNELDFAKPKKITNKPVKVSSGGETD